MLCKVKRLCTAGFLQKNIFVLGFNSPSKHPKTKFTIFAFNGTESTIISLLFSDFWLKNSWITNHGFYFILRKVTNVEPRHNYWEVWNLASKPKPYYSKDCVLMLGFIVTWSKVTANQLNIYPARNLLIQGRYRYCHKLCCCNPRIRFK